MDRSKVDAIVEAMLYEGYILYPYRPSSTKNRQRFTFGRVYPRAYSLAQKGREPCVMQTQCLVEASLNEMTLDVSIRFLHPVLRQVGRISKPVPETPGNEVRSIENVPELTVEGVLNQSWQEAVERTVEVRQLSLPVLVRAVRRVPFIFSSSYASEVIQDSHGNEVGIIQRRQEKVKGIVEIAAEPVDARVFRLTVRILNETPASEGSLVDPEAIVMKTFASTHTVLYAYNGAFLSQMDPPADYAHASSACRNEHTWPVLVGDESTGERDTILSSPIILYDYPRIAPESPGDFFDGTEIDELLTLRIQTMTAEEKREMHFVDALARQLLQRAETIPFDRMRAMHGTIRDRDTRENEYFASHRPLDSITVGSIRFSKGDRVRIRPRRRADAIDLALDGKTAVIEGVEQDFEERIYLALVLDDDPGRDLGLMRQAGHRFFYSPDEVEPMGVGA